MFVFILFLSQFCVILCSLFSSRKQARARERERQNSECIYNIHTCKFSLYTYTITFFFFSLFRRIARFFLFDTHTVSWLLCISTSFFSSPSLFLSILEPTHVYTHTHTHISKSSFVFFCPVFSLLIACWRRLAFFFFLCVRGPVCTFFVFFFFLLVFFLLLFLLLQCQHHERRPTDRQSTTTCFTQLKESNGSSGNSSKTRNNNASNNFSFNLQYNIVSLRFVFCVRVFIFSSSFSLLFNFIHLSPLFGTRNLSPFQLYIYIYIYLYINDEY